jgi:RHS repeat-associated protein
MSNGLLGNYVELLEIENRLGRDPYRPARKSQVRNVDAGVGEGNYLLQIPLLSLPGRGLNLSLNLYYNSKLWTRQTFPNGTENLVFDRGGGWPAPGWSLGFGRVVFDGANNVLQDADGTVHPFSSSGTGLHTTDGTLIDYSTNLKDYSTNLKDGNGAARHPDGTTISYGAGSPSPGNYYFVWRLYPTTITDANGNTIEITYVNDAGPAIERITDTTGRVVDFFYDTNNVSLLTAIEAPGLNGATRQVARFHYFGVIAGGSGQPRLVAGPGPVYWLPAVGAWMIDAIYLPGTSTGYWFGDPDSYTIDSGIITKVSQRREMTLTSTSASDQGTITPGMVTRECRYNYGTNLEGTTIPTYTTMSERWAGMDTLEATTTYTVDNTSSPRRTDTVYPDGSQVSQLIFNHPGQYDDGLLYQTMTYDSAGEQILLQQTATTWEQGDYDSPRVAAIEITDQLGQTIKTTYGYLSPTNQLTDVTQFDYDGSTILRRTHTDYVTDPGYGNLGSHIFNLPELVEVYDQAGWGAITSDPVVARNADGRLEVFARGTDSALWHNWQTAPGGGWAGWAPVAPGSAITSDPVVEINADGRLEVFARGTDNALWRNSQTAPGGHGWYGWVSVGGAFFDPAAARDVAVVARNADGRLEAFARGTDRALWHNRQTTPGDGWAGWVPAAPGSAITSDPVVGINADGRLEVFARGTDGALWHNWQTAPGGPGWSGWASLGGIFPISGAAAFNVAVVARNADGRLEVFARGTDSALWHNWQTTPGDGWAGWASLAPGSAITSDPAVGINADGRLEVFARGTDGALWHNWQQPAAAGGGWSGWASLAPGSAITSDPAVGINADGRLEVFARGTDGTLWHNRQTTPGNGWSGWAPLSVAASRSYYEYDAQELADAPGVVGHSDPGTTYRGNITQITRFADAANNSNDVIESRQYDITGNLISRSGQPYVQMTYTYDVGTQYAYPSTVTRGAADPASPARVTQSFTYDFGTGLQLSATDANGRTTNSDYDNGSLRIQQVTLPTGAFSQYSYDDASMGGSTVTQTTHTAAGDIAGQTTTHFNGRGLVAAVVTGRPPTWTGVATQYDVLGRPWQFSQPYSLGPTGLPLVPQLWTSLTRDALGRITSVQDPDGRQWTWYYDEPQRPDPPPHAPGGTVRVQSPSITWLGKTVNGADRWYRMDALGSLAEVREPNAYGPWPGGSVFDPAGNVKTSYSYNALGLLVQVSQGTAARGASSQYDPLGRLTAQSLPEKAMTLDSTGTYVGPGNLARWSDVFTYDNWSNLTSHTDARGVKTIYTYSADPLNPTDPLNRLYGVSYENVGPADASIEPTSAISYAYMPTGDVTRLLKATTSPIAKTEVVCEYGYNPDGLVIATRLTWSKPGTASTPLRVDYAYDTLGRLITETYPVESGAAKQAGQRKTVDYGYNLMGQLASVQVSGVDYASGLVYNPAGQATTITVGPAASQALMETYEYDPKTNLLTSQQVQRGGTGLLDLAYSYWPNGQLESLTDKQGNRQFIYLYDALGRLWQAFGTDGAEQWTEEYTFDEYGNRTSVTASGQLNGAAAPADGLPSLAYDPATNHISTAGFAYDLAGNLTRGQRTDGTWLRYQYDQAGRLVTVTSDNGQPIESYGYGADGKRLITRRAGDSTYFVWSRDRLIAEYTQRANQSGLRWSTSRIYLGNRTLATVTPAQPQEIVFYQHPDRLGTRLVTNNTDNTTWEQTTLPFGTLTPGTTRWINPVFTTYDAGSIPGLYYAINRTHDAELRFTQPDPIGLAAVDTSHPQTLNLYTYANNDPINSTDPTGLQSGAGTGQTSTFGAPVNPQGVQQGIWELWPGWAKAAYLWLNSFAAPPILEGADALYSQTYIATITTSGITINDVVESQSSASPVYVEQIKFVNIFGVTTSTGLIAAQDNADGSSNVTVITPDGTQIDRYTEDSGFQVETTTLPNGQTSAVAYNPDGSLYYPGQEMAGPGTTDSPYDSYDLLGAGGY